MKQPSLRSAIWIGCGSVSWDASNSPSGLQRYRPATESSKAFVNEHGARPRGSTSPSRRNSVPKLATHIRVAFSRIDLKTGSNSPGDELMTLRTSEVAVCCSSDSLDRQCAAQFVQQPRVLDGDDGLGGEVLD